MVKVIGNKTPQADLIGDETLNDSSVVDGGGAEGNTDSSFQPQFRSVAVGTLYATAVIGSSIEGDKIIIILTYFGPSNWEVKRNGSTVFSGTGGSLDLDGNSVGSKILVDTIPSNASYTYTLFGTANPSIIRSFQLRAIKLSVTDTHAAIGGKSKGTVILN